MKMLTEQEVADILRCSRGKVKRLRFSGKLPYIPGRPLLIDEVDLLAYIEASKREVQAKAQAADTKPTISAQEWARLALLKPKRAPRSR
ncbi:helix-turn-helix domain-containing protein [Rhizobium sp. S152]|uniref:helix-turn-helix domain-containing protein n=1 Tax=Rhizobium sp. S152 TaxID=3055038 RepID=UPI0025AA2A8C|nr:helix-turn-helix domain-containing protein [Rhizobium sp. S152]MDM9629779.1 helix-turn-helix domain-containing protein [Rhizobium sp. S152]